MDLHESGEMYLETILTLKNQNQFVRSIDVANALNYSKPSVSRAIKLLKESQLITLDEKGYIDFTHQGKAIAEGVYDRHQVLTQLLKTVGVNDEMAEHDACRIEHVISEETYQSIKAYIQKQS